MMMKVVAFIVVIQCEQRRGMHMFFTWEITIMLFSACSVIVKKMVNCVHRLPSQLQKKKRG